MVSSIDASEHASKKVQEKGTAALFNATAPFFYTPSIETANALAGSAAPL